MKVLAIGLGFGAIICWSLNSLMIDRGLKDSSLFKFNAIRTLPASILLVLFMLLTERTIFPGLKLSALAFFTGFSSYFVALSLFVGGLGRGDTHKIWPVGNTAPLWATVSAIFVLGETANPFIIFSVVLVVTGIFFLGGRDKNESGGNGNKGIPLAFLAAFIWGILIVPNKYCLNHGMSPLSFLTVMIIAATISNNIFFLHREGFREIVKNKRGIYWGIASGMIALFAGGLFWQFALSMEDASRLALLLGAESPIVLLLSVAFLEEIPTKKSIFGVTLVFFGVLLVTAFG